MRTGFIISLLMHVAVLVVAIAGLPRFNGEPEPILTAIPVGVISEADLARLDVLPSEPATLLEPPQIEVPEEPPPPPETELAALPPVPVERPEPPPSPDVPEVRPPEPPPEAELAPEPVMPEPELAPPPEPVAETEPEPELEPSVEPMLEPEPEPEPEIEIAEAPELAEEPEPVTEVAEDVPPDPVAAEDPPVTQVAALPSVPPPPRRPEPPQAEEEQAPQSNFGSMLSSLAAGQLDTKRSNNPSRLPPALEQAVRQAIKPCWNIDPSAPDARETIVEVAVEMRQDGTVADARIIDQGRYGTDAIFKSAADRAMRAVRNTSCQPLPLPASTYDEWRRMTLVFDPRDFFF